jgi:hypothetical protein
LWALRDHDASQNPTLSPTMTCTPASPSVNVTEGTERDLCTANSIGMQDGNSTTALEKILPFVLQPQIIHHHDIEPYVSGLCFIKNILPLLSSSDGHKPPQQFASNDVYLLLAPSIRVCSHKSHTHTHSLLRFDRRGILHRSVNQSGPGNAAQCQSDGTFSQTIECLLFRLR